MNIRHPLIMVASITSTACTPGGQALETGDSPGGDSGAWSCTGTTSVVETFDGDELSTPDWEAVEGKEPCGTDNGIADYPLDPECYLQHPVCLQHSEVTLSFRAGLVCDYACVVHLQLRQGGGQGEDVMALKVGWQYDLKNAVVGEDHVKVEILGTETRLDYPVNAQVDVRHDYTLEYDHGLVTVSIDGTPHLEQLRVASEDRVLRADTLRLFVMDRNHEGSTRLDELLFGAW
jgi:hypothetical protein